MLLLSGLRVSPAGFRLGDKVLKLDGQTPISIGDMQWCVSPANVGVLGDLANLI